MSQEPHGYWLPGHPPRDGRLCRLQPKAAARVLLIAVSRSTLSLHMRTDHELATWKRLVIDFSPHRREVEGSRKKPFEIPIRDGREIFN